MVETLRIFFTRLFTLDLRALALWRMALGAISLLDIALRARDLQLFYGDAGVLSRPFYFTQSWQFEGYNLFLAAGSLGTLLALFGLWAAAATCLMIGYHSRLAGLLTWYFSAAVQLRNPMVLDGGDDFIRVLLFWTPFLPLGARWSVDARSFPQWRSLPNAYASVATAGVVFQLFVFYLFAALLKFGNEWLVTGDSLYYALSMDQFATGFGQYLAGYPNLLRPMTWAALALEYGLALLLLLRGLTPRAQSAFYLLAVGFHLAIASMLNFGLFMPIVIAGLTVMFPTVWLERLAPSTSVDSSAPQPLPSGYRLSLPLRLLGAGIIVMIAIFNGHSIEHQQRVPRWSWPIAKLTFEQQHWHFFAPDPIKSDGWFRLEVTGEDGKVVDAWPFGEIPAKGKPRHVASTFPNQRWRRWMQNLTDIDNRSNVSWRARTLEWLVKDWQQRHPEEKARGFALVLMVEPTPPPGESSSPHRLVLATLGGPKEVRPPGVPRTGEGRNESEGRAL